MEKKAGISVKLIIAVALVAAAAIALVAFFTVKKQKDESGSYRTIRIYALDGGSAQVDREDIGSLDAYIDMLLQSADEVKTMVNCYMQLQLDDDKYVMAEPDTRFKLNAEGSAKVSRTTIELLEGSIVNKLDNKLSEDSEYVVNTPNSTMAVRGTCFRVTVYYDEEGTSHTILEVYEGTVECHLIYPDGSEEKEAVMVEAGTKVTIRGDSTISEYEYTDGEIVYSEYENPVLDFIDAHVENAEEMMAANTWKVTFTYNGSTFGTQYVGDGDRAVEPELMPAASGHWDFDFNTEIYEDTEIQWIG